MMCCCLKKSSAAGGKRKDSRFQSRSSQTSSEKRTKFFQLKPLSVATYGAAHTESGPRIENLTASDFFEFERIVGQGTSGVVMQAIFKETQERLALKYMVNYLNWKQHVFNELKVLHVSHKCRYLLEMHSYFQIDYKYLYIVFNLCATNFDYLTQGGHVLSQGLTRIYFKELCTAIRFLHKRNVVHRDITLKNLLLDYEGHVRLGDYGHCRVITNPWGEIFSDTGNLAYKAPEIYKDRRCSYGVDWWSAGVVLYRLSIGIFPFKTNLKMGSSFLAVTTQTVEYPTESYRVPGLHGMIQGLLNKKQEKRLGFVSEDDIKDHVYFSELDLEWEEVEDVAAYIKANAARDPLWCLTSYKRIMAILNITESDLSQPLDLDAIPSSYIM